MAPNETVPTSPGGGRWWHRLRLRAVLVVIVLIPTVGMLLLSLIGARQAEDRRDAAQRLHDDAEMMLDLADGRAAIADEEVASSVLVVAADAGVGPEVIEEIYGVDYTVELAEARALVDGSETLNGMPTLTEPLAQLRRARTEVDDGTIDFAHLNAVIRDLTRSVDRAWTNLLDQRARDRASAGLPAEARVRIDSLIEAYEALSAGSDLATLALSMAVQGPTRGELATAMAARTRYETAISRFGRVLGARATAAWREHRSEPAAERFERTLDQVVDGALAQQPSPYADDLQAFGDAFIDGTDWGDGLSMIVRGAVADLDELTHRNLTDANRDLWLMRGGTLALALLSMAGAVLVAGWVVRPVGALERAAQLVHQGHFDIDPIDPHGPRELGDTARAFNDMATTLAAVESHAVALADDPGAPILSDRLPGRTGRALQLALTRLRTSMQIAEEQRRELKRAATHDDLTGLMNRPAAMEVLERDLSRRSRGGGAVAAIFVDLDGLKEINDRYGHAAGDDALRLTADAIAGAVRSTDVAARLGGDEFIVTATVHDIPAEVQALAERIHAEITSQRLVCPDTTLPIRASIGVAMADETDDATTLVSKADAAMYRAKNAGKNRIAWYEEPDPEVAEGDEAAQRSP